jgi:predicted metal-dependent enzyme (double-stranded beta helix superfamily)
MGLASAVRQVTPDQVIGAAQTRIAPAQLADIVRETAAAKHSWRPIVQFTPEHRWFRRLALTTDYEVWLLSWLPGQRTGFHDHGEARGAFAVAQGDLLESLAVRGRSDVRHRTAMAGSVTSFGSRHLHDVSNVGAAPAVSVHAYSPPLTAMRRYEMTSSGLVMVGTERAEINW